jgi:TonB family protein
MDGTLNNHGLLDVIAALTSRGESGRLQITVAGSRGAFFFKKGKLVDARMGPFSGFPAVNLAISMGEAILKFDSSIQPPASSFIAINERVLLKERFGIQTIDLEPIEDQTTETEGAKLPVAITPQVPLPEATLSPEASALQEYAFKKPAEGNIKSRASAQESRRRAARSRRAGRKKSTSETQQIADQLRNQAEEEARTKVEREKSFEMAHRIAEEEPGQITSPAITLEPPPSQPARDPRIKTIAEEEKPSQTYGPAITLESSAIEMRKDAETKRCPKCKRVYSDYRIYCRYDSTQLVSESDPSFNAAVKPEAATRPALFWTLITITLFVSGGLGYLLNSYISREPSAATPIRAESAQPSNADQDQPVVEGPLHGKETSLIKPDYPARAKTEGVSGKVTVAVLANKQGRVVSARALDGHPLLKVAAVMAARQAKFSPEKLEDQRSKNSGTITYSFKL